MVKTGIIEIPYVITVTFADGSTEKISGIYYGVAAGNVEAEVKQIEAYTGTNCYWKNN